jgi:hypothetical protein
VAEPAGVERLAGGQAQSRALQHALVVRESACGETHALQ